MKYEEFLFFIIYHLLLGFSGHYLLSIKDRYFKCYVNGHSLRGGGPQAREGTLQRAEPKFSISPL